MTSTIDERFRDSDFEEHLRNNPRSHREVTRTFLMPDNEDGMRQAYLGRLIDSKDNSGKNYALVIKVEWYDSPNASIAGN